jgi:hypothetical protein
MVITMARRDESAAAGKLVITTQRLDGNTCMKLFLLGHAPVVSFDMATNPGVGSRARAGAGANCDVVAEHQASPQSQSAIRTPSSSIRTPSSSIRTPSSSIRTPSSSIRTPNSEPERRIGYTL